MSQEPSKEVNEINQLLAQAKNAIYASCGSATGMIGDTVSGILVNFGRKMAMDKAEIIQLKKEIEELKKVPQKDKKQ